MRVLLDTHTLLWFLEGDARLSPRASSIISAPQNQSFVSDATAWEMGIKQSLGKLKIPLPYEELFPGRLQSEGFYTLPILHKHLHQLVKLAWHHHDPFDRLLIAQSLAEDLVVITCDPHFSTYGVPVIW